MHATRTGPRIALTLALALCCAPGSAPAQEAEAAAAALEPDTGPALYLEAMAIAEAQEREGEYAAAAAGLTQVLPQYPQDNTLLLKLAWDEYLAGNGRDAVRRYQQALTRRLWPEDAYLGLGLALEEQGACGSARVYLRNALVLKPGDAPALRALERCQDLDDFQVTPQLYLIGGYYPTDNNKTYSGGAALGVTLNYLRSWHVGALYRFIGFAGPSYSWAQQEAYLSASYSRPRFAVALSTAFIYDGSGSASIGDSFHLGLSGRLSLLGDINLNTSVSIYTPLANLETVLRGELSWRIPIGSVVSLQPGVASYVSNVANAGQGYISVPLMGMVSLFVSGRRGSVWLGGKVGDEFRSAYLDLPVVYNVNEHIAAGGWIGGRLSLGRRWALSAHAAWDLYYQGDPTVANTTVGASHGFYLTLGASRVF